jgi:hypothetical protein
MPDLFQRGAFGHVRIADDEVKEILSEASGVADGTRAHDIRNHNPGTFNENSSGYAHFVEDDAPRGVAP